MAKEIKTTRQHVESGAKYSGSSLALATALTGIVIFFKPDWQPIDQYMLALSAFTFNIAIIYLFKGK